MDKKNITFLHSLLFAVSVIVLVYSGEQVKSNPNQIADCLMRCAVGAAVLSIIGVGLSFAPAVRSNRAAEQKDRSDQVVHGLYSYSGVDLEYIHRDTVAKIDAGGRDVGYFAAVQDMNDRWNRRLMHLSLWSMITAVILYGLGVFFI